MRLSDLSPRWFVHGGNERAGFVFRCPHCKSMWLSCWPEAPDVEGQCEVFEAIFPEMRNGRIDVVPCRPNGGWSIAGDGFADLSVTPSLDASASGHWHGFITKGEIVGGLPA